MDIYQPYTYHIAWSGIDKHYYGVRHAKTCHPEDLWKTYFTSSRKVCEYRKLYGEPDIIEVRRIFNDAYAAKRWEYNVLRRLNVLKSDRWLNSNIGGEQFIIEKHSEETKQKMRDSCASKRPEMRKHISERQMGHNNSFFGKSHTEESNAKRREKCSGLLWWTDGHTEVKTRICPAGFTRGRKSKS